MSEELELIIKLCPFCGGQPIIKNNYVVCIDCCSRTVKFLTQEEALKQWNQRA